MVDLALKSLLHDKTRFAITLAGVIFAVTLVLSQVGLFLGLLDNASCTIDECNADLWVSSEGTPNIDFGHIFSERYVDRVRSVPGVERADNMIVTYCAVAQPSGAEETAIMYAMDNFGPWGIPWNIAEGTIEDLRRGPNVLLDDSATKRFGPFRVGEHREIHGKRVRVVGRTHGAVSFTTYPMLFVDTALVRTLLPELSQGGTTYVVVKLAPGADINQVRSAIAQRLPHNDVWTKREWRERSRAYWLWTTGLGLNMFVTIALGCLVGLVVVAQNLYTSTLEHLHEYGTLKAIGGTNLDIYRILTKQAVVCALLGFAAGIVPVLVLQAIVPQAGLKIVLPGWLFGLTFVGTLALCLLSALASFRKIATLDPAIVFRG